MEIFTEDRRHTGLRFLVQLKATSTKGDLRVRLSHGTADYYQRLALPVLIVFYYAPEETVFARWFHSLDPHYDDNLNEKSVSLKMRNEDRWDEQTPASLRSDVEHFRQADQGALHTPVPLSVSIEEEQVGGLSKALLLSAVRGAAASVGGLVDLRAGGEKMFAHLTANSEESRVHVGGSRAGATMHLHGEDINVQGFGADVLMLLGLALEQVNHFDIAALLFEPAAPQSSLLEDRSIFPHVLRSFTQAHMVKEALALSEELDERDVLQDAPRLLAAFVSLSKEGLSRSDRAFIEHYWHRQIDGFKDEDNHLAKSYYNFGNFLRTGRRNLESIKAYRQAARVDSDYWKRDYFCGELAGILFEAGRYRVAASLYERALELASDEKGEQRWRPLWADTLMQAGQYAEAHKHFASYLREADLPDEEWLFKAEMLEYLSATLGIGKQQRDREEAARLATDEAKASRHQFTEALRRDALCSSAWYNLGHHIQAENQKEAAQAFLNAAIVNHYDVEAWAYAFLLMIFSEETAEKALAAAAVAYRFNEEKFVREVYREIDEQPSGFPSQKVRRVFDELIQQLRQSEDQGASVLRLHREDGEYESIVIGGKPGKHGV